MPKQKSNRRGVEISNESGHYLLSEKDLLCDNGSFSDHEIEQLLSMEISAEELEQRLDSDYNKLIEQSRQDIELPVSVQKQSRSKRARNRAVKSASQISENYPYELPKKKKQKSKKKARSIKRSVTSKEDCILISDDENEDDCKIVDELILLRDDLTGVFEIEPDDQIEAGDQFEADDQFEPDGQIKQHVHIEQDGLTELVDQSEPDIGSTTIESIETTSSPEKISQSEALLRLTQFLHNTPAGLVDLRVAMKQLGIGKPHWVQKMRVSVVKVLQGIGLMEKHSQRFVDWKGGNKTAGQKSVQKHLVALRQMVVEMQRKEVVLNEHIDWLKQVIHDTCKNHAEILYNGYEDLVQLFPDSLVLGLKSSPTARLRITPSVDCDSEGSEQLRIHVTSDRGQVELRGLSSNVEQIKGPAISEPTHKKSPEDIKYSA